MSKFSPNYRGYTRQFLLMIFLTALTLRVNYDIFDHSFVDSPLVKYVVVGLFLGFFGFLWLDARFSAMEIESLLQKPYFLRKAELRYGLFILTLVGAVILIEMPALLRALNLSVGLDGKITVGLRDEATGASAIRGADMPQALAADPLVGDQHSGRPARPQFRKRRRLA